MFEPRNGVGTIGDQVRPSSAEWDVTLWRVWCSRTTARKRPSSSRITSMSL